MKPASSLPVDMTMLGRNLRANIQYFENETNRETPLFVGRVVAALAADASVFELTGRWLVAAEVAESTELLTSMESGQRPIERRSSARPPAETA
jgi:hypothetical protein